MITEAFKNRVWVGLALLFLLSGATYAGTTVFFTLMMVMILIAGYEWGGLSGLSKWASWIYAGIIGCMSLTWFGAENYVIFAVPVVLGLMLWHIRWMVLAGIVVLPYVFNSILLLTQYSQELFGIWWLALMYVWGMVIIMDTGAYLVGKAFGKTPLAPKISPGKTWEGFLGGLIVTIIATVIFYMIFADTLGLDGLNLWIAGTVVVVTFAQLGDLCESKMKRRIGIKDSGTILQQHGGVLDRIDGLIGAIVIVRILLGILGYAGIL